MAEDITWAEPPPINRSTDKRQGKWSLRFQELMEHPGRWAMWRVNTAGTANNYGYGIRHGTFPGCPPGKWQATTREVADGHYLYVRYMGPE